MGEDFHRGALVQIKSSTRFMYIDENDFTKKYKSLRKYCPKSFKHFCFDLIKNINSNIDGNYSVSLPTGKEFKLIYGQIKLIYSIRNGIVMIENLEPSEFFLEGYRKDLEIYKGIPCRNKKDKFKIDTILKLKEIGG